MKNHLQQYLYHLALILALCVGGVLSSAEVFGALPASPVVDAEKIILSDFVAERDAAGVQEEWGGTPTKPAALAADLADPAVGPALLDFLSGNAPGITAANRVNRLKAWDILNYAGYASLRKNPISLQKLSDLISNPNLTNSDLTKTLVKRALKGNREAGAGAAALDDLTDGLNSLVNSGTNFTNYTRLISDLEKGGTFAEGAGWIQKYVIGNISEFAGKNLEFEVGVISGRVDLKVGNILYEFKSVGSLPPGSFTSQVARDLQNVTSFDQMKWYFDGNKLPNGIMQADKDAMLTALDNMNINQATIDKFVPGGTVQDVVDGIENVFSQIFQVK